MSKVEIATRVARAGFEDHRWFGHAVIAELFGSESLLGLVMLAATGRRPSAEERRLLDDFTVAITVADPRIWPLKIGRLIASYGSAMAGFGAAQLAVECDAIGPWVAEPAARMLMEIQEQAGDVADDEAFTRAARDAIAKRSILYGYGVAFRPHDERYLALRRRLEELGRTSLPWWRLQDRLTEIVRAEKRTEPNVAIATAAMMLDMGLSPTQARVVTVFAMEHMFYANAVEGAEQSAPILRELPADRVRYAGPAPRDSPRKRK